MEHEIFVTIPTGNPADPYQRVTLQQFADRFVGVALDLRSENAQLRELVASLTTCVENMQHGFDGITREMHSTTQQARAMLAGVKPAKGVN